MTPLNDGLTGLLRRLSQEPDCGTELVIADAFEEAGQPERAELIRVQCELAEAYPAEVSGRSDHLLRSAQGSYYHLRRREHDLLAALPTPAGLTLNWERGLIRSVHAPLDQLREHLPRLGAELLVVRECRAVNCDPDYFTRAEDGDLDGSGWFKLSECDDTQREHPDNLPDDLWHELKQAEHQINPSWKCYGIEQTDLAHADLSRAILSEARERAGLELKRKRKKVTT